MMGCGYDCKLQPEVKDQKLMESVSLVETSVRIVIGCEWRKDMKDCERFKLLQ